MLSPRDRYLTIYGRNPVLEALEDLGAPVAKVLVAANARGEAIDRILKLAKQRQVDCRRVPPQEVTRVSRNGRQDQGVVADVEPARLTTVDEWVGGYAGGRTRVLLLDGVTTPANVGMIIRTVTAAGWDGIVVPRFGVAEIGPLVVKASAGVAFRAPIMRGPTAHEALDALSRKGIQAVGLRGRDAPSLFDAALPEQAVFVLGGETAGVSTASEDRIDRWVSIPLHAGVESLNVAAAAAVLAYEVARRDELAR